MPLNASQSPLPVPEFVTLLALMVSIVALSTDIMLPGLDAIGRELEVARANDVQLIVTTLFLGLTVGQLLAGPLSDRFGRRPIIHCGFTLFSIGSLLCIFATSFTVLLVGRILQGIGAAGPRIVTMAIVRDSHEGREMARIMSIIMMIFILMPAIAPAIGEGILLLGNWRGTFIALLIFALISWSWFAVRLPESLVPERRRALTVLSIKHGLKLFYTSKIAMGYTLTSGLIFGPFISYLSTAQQIFKQTYNTGSWFAFWFAFAALAIGSASALNATLVVRLGMRKMVGAALLILITASCLFFIFVQVNHGVPPFLYFMIWLLVAFACVGILFGNLNALAMEPLGEIAGLGAALIGSLSTCIALPLAWLIGQGYDGGINALVGGFAVLPAAAILTIYIIERKQSAA